MGKERMALVAAALLVALGGLVHAPCVRAEQGGDTPPGQLRSKGGQGRWSAGERLARMTERLNLTEAQQARIKPIIEDEGKQLKALRDDTSLTRDQKREKFREISTVTFANIDAVLTPEQQKKHVELREKAREHWKKMRTPGPGRGT